MKEADIPLVRGGRLTREMIDWIEKVSAHFPGVEKDLVIIQSRGAESERTQSAERSRGRHRSCR
jgi:hypothetical protein